MSAERRTDFQDSRCGAFRTQDGIDLPDLWRVIHLNARLAERAAAVSGKDEAAGPIRDMQRAWDAHRTQLASVPIGRWQGLCSSAGWTWAAAAASSWCQNADAAQMWAAFRSCVAPPQSKVAFRYAINLANPAFLQIDLTVSELSFARGEVDMTMLSVMLVAAPSRVVAQDQSSADRLRDSGFLAMHDD